MEELERWAGVDVTSTERLIINHDLLLKKISNLLVVLLIAWLFGLLTMRLIGIFG
jgi:hypothetical protein